MNKRRSIEAIIILLSLCFSTFVFAETIVFKWGTKVEVEIVEKTDEHIKVNANGTTLVYSIEDIESIDGEKPVVFSVKKEEISVQTPEYPQKQQVKQEGEYYTNNEYGIRIWHPRDWQVFDRNLHPDVFKTVLSATPQVTNAEVICALSSGKDRNALDPLIMIIVEPFPDNLRDLPAGDLSKLMGQHFRQSPLPPGESIIEYPSAIVVSGNEFAKYIGTGITQYGKTKYAYYVFVKGTKLYTISCGTKADIFDMYRTAFEDIAGSVKAY